MESVQQAEPETQGNTRLQPLVRAETAEWIRIRAVLERKSHGEVVDEIVASFRAAREKGENNNG